MRLDPLNGDGEIRCGRDGCGTVIPLRLACPSCPTCGFQTSVPSLASIVGATKRRISKLSPEALAAFNVLQERGLRIRAEDRATQLELALILTRAGCDGQVKVHPETGEITPVADAPAPAPASAPAPE